MLKQQLQQKLQQKLSPAQIQVIKMLEVPTLELEERIRQEIEETVRGLADSEQILQSFDPSEDESIQDEE